MTTEENADTPAQSETNSDETTAPPADESLPPSTTRPTPPPPVAEHHHPHKQALPLLILGALGIVYGDIGTSPLYAFRESFHEHHDIPVSPDNILGILSLIFWSLILVISVKYLLFVLRADNHGEGGILALTALVSPVRAARRGSPRWGLIMLGIFGTALLYGDGIITPAISVLSAVEGLEVATPAFEPYILPITITILVGLFLFQSRGTEKVGKVFGPVTLIWFIVLGALGLYWIVQEPGVFVALNPWLGVQFFIHNGWQGFLVLGSVFLVVTGGEALYADMGHFSRTPIRWAWFTIVLPALLLNYFGQGALLLLEPEAAENPFYYMAPEWALYPVVAIATLATVIASQALITGAFSLTRQAVQLGYLPRFEINHTSEDEIGQIYIPAINWALMVACVALVVTFRTSSNLAAAYGIAVTATMAITTILLVVVAKERWKWSTPAVVLFAAFFLTIDLAFLGANIVKIPQGGWVPLVLGVVVFTLMTTWKRGRRLLAERLRAQTMPFAEFAERLSHQPIPRVPGTAVFLYSDPDGTPPALLQNLKHNKVLHEDVVLLSVVWDENPKVPLKNRARIQSIEHDFHRIWLCYGFMESPNVVRDLALIEQPGLDLSPDRVSFFLGREWLLATDAPGMAIWREKLFALMSQNSRNATDFFRLPPSRVVELGTQVEL